jgi:hypothetical protein
MNTSAYITSNACFRCSNISSCRHSKMGLNLSMSVAQYSMQLSMRVAHATKSLNFVIGCISECVQLSNENS